MSHQQVAAEVGGDDARVDEGVEGADEAQDGDLCDLAQVGEAIDAALVLLVAICCQTLEPFVLRPRGQLRALTLIAVVVVVVATVVVVVIVVPGIVTMWSGLTASAYEVEWTR